MFNTIPVMHKKWRVHKSVTAPATNVLISPDGNSPQNLQCLHICQLDSCFRSQVKSHTRYSLVEGVFSAMGVSWTFKKKSLTIISSAKVFYNHITDGKWTEFILSLCRTTYWLAICIPMNLYILYATPEFLKNLENKRPSIKMHAAYQCMSHSTARYLKSIWGPQKHTQNQRLSSYLNTDYFKKTHT